MSEIRFAYAPRYEGYRGIYDFGGRHSVCKHTHRTENAAMSCAKKTRARFNRGELVKK